MEILDSNVVIYAADPAYASLRTFVRKGTAAVSIITVVEALGYHAIKPSEQTFLEEFFSTAMLLLIGDAVVDKAVELRQMRKMSLGDALIAATALTTGRTLVTRNTKDFAWIPGLTLLDPLAGPAVNGTHSPP